MEIIGFIIGFILLVFVRVLFVVIIQGIFLGIWKIITGFFSIFTGSSSEKPQPRPRLQPSYDPAPRTTSSPIPQRPGRVDDLGVDSTWSNAEKRAHLLKEYAKHNARMQVIKDKWLRDDCQRQMDKITRAIMALNRQGGM